jgi:hypothetical protein
VDRIEAVVVGEAQIRRCDFQACMDRCGYPPTPQCEDACDMDCIATDGQWIANTTWMVENEGLLEELVRKVQECQR